MDIKEKKFLERDIFKKLRNSSSTFERRNVEINVEIYLKSFFKKNSKKKYVGIYWPLKNEIDLRGLKGKYLLALPRCKTDKKLLFCSWNNDRLTKDHEGIFAPDSSNKLSFDEIGIIFVPCLKI